MDNLHFEIHDDPDGIHWNELLSELTNAHILQTSYWAQVKGRVGWNAKYLIWKNAHSEIKAGAMVLIKKLPVISRLFNNCIIYIPRGPVLDWSDCMLVGKVLDDLLAFGKKQNAIFLKIDPDLVIGIGFPGSEMYQSELTGQLNLDVLIKAGWTFSSDQIQFRNTVLLGLTLSEKELLSQMKPKTRYNISLANRKGVIVRRGNRDDFPILYRMYAQTALRDGFAIRGEEYYQYVWSLLYEAGMAFPLIAEVEGKPVSALVLFIYAGKAYYFYGMSTGEDREKMPNYILQWEAIRLAKSQGCLQYDFWGAPDNFSEEDPMWGVYRFKDGFNGSLITGIGAWDFVINNNWFSIYSRFIPTVLDLLRKIGRRRLAKEVNL